MNRSLAVHVAVHVAMRAERHSRETEGSGTGALLDEEVCALEVFGEVDLNRVEVGDVDRLDVQLVLLDRKLQAAFDAIGLADIAIETGPANLVANLQTPKGLVQLQSLGI